MDEKERENTYRGRNLKILEKHVPTGLIAKGRKGADRIGNGGRGKNSSRRRMKKRRWRRRSKISKSAL